LIPLGVHVGNRGRGSLLYSTAASGLAGVAAFGISLASDSAIGLIVAPAIQIPLSVYIQRHTSN
jgi:hypothetical protein